MDLQAIKEHSNEQGALQFNKTRKQLFTVMTRIFKHILLLLLLKYIM